MSTLRKLFGNIVSALTASEKRRFKILVILNTIANITDIASLALLIYVVSFYTHQGNSIKIQGLPDWLLQQDSLLLITLVMLLFVIKNIAAYFITVFQYRFVYRVASRMSHSNLFSYLHGEYLDYVNTDAAVHIKKINQHPIEFCHYLLFGLQQIITESLLVLFSVTAIVIFNAKLFLLLFIMLLPPTIFISMLNRRQLRSVRKNIQHSGEMALQYLQEAISGYIESCIYERQQYFSARYASQQSRLNNYIAALQIVQNLPSRMFEVFAVLGLFLLIVISKISSNSTLIDVTTMGAFIAAAYKIIPGVVKIFNITGQMKTFEYTVGELTTKASVKYEKNIVVPFDERTKIESIVFKSVSFYYNEQPLLEDFNLSLQQSAITGIAGKSGKGKTTVIHLLLGFLNPHKGEILFNREIVNATERKSFWKSVAYVKQQTFLLHDTILNNIILDDVQYDKARLQQAITVSGLNEMVSKYPDGLLTTITEKGKNISGGQRQRIVLARALYKDADLLILDEPFSELDDNSMLEIMRHLREFVDTGKLILLVSHNQKSLSFCDKIIPVNE